MNRSYYRQPSSPWGQSFVRTMVGRLILINIGVFFIQNIFPAFATLFVLTPRLVVEKLFVWQLVTYMFLHGSFIHLFFNMFMLWIFGSTIESVWGPRQFLRYYLICGVGGALASLLFNYNSHIIGASGAIFGLFLAYAMMFPDSYIYLYFLFPIKAKYLVAGLTILQLASGISGPSGIAYFAHLGGMAAGLIFFKSEVLQRMRFSFGAKRKWRQYVDEKDQEDTERETDNIDSILDKISSKGYDNLTTTERRILENYSRKQNNESD